MGAAVTPDAEAVIRAWLAGQFPDPVLVCTETDEDLATTAETIQVVGAGGSSRLVLHKPRVVIHTFAIAAAPLSARQVARQLALEVDTAMRLVLPRTKFSDGLAVTAVEVVSSPSFVPDANTDLRHFVATYALTFRATA